MSETTTQTRKKPLISIQQMAVIAVMTAVTCVIAPFSLPIGPVPISLGSFAIYLSVYVLGWKRATISCVIYLLLGLVGVPVFSGWQAGPAKLFGPTGGYLIGYLLVTIVAGVLIDKFYDMLWVGVLALVLGTLLLYAAGTAWLAYQGSMSFTEALWMGVIPFIPGDIAKIIIAMVVGIPVRSRLKQANLF